MSGPAVSVLCLVLLGLGGCGDDLTALGGDDNFWPVTTGPVPEVMESSDGADEDSGDSLPPPECGNGFTEMGEACDHQGESALCDADCTYAECGDGVHNPAAGEACDDGEATEECDADCTFAECGDGVYNPAAGEACDDGGTSSSCNIDCTVSLCGDGIHNPVSGEQCDDGGQTPRCDLDCTLVECGDGIVNPSVGEECDDLVETETCDADCTFAECGDGVRNTTAGESCDGMGESVSCNADCSDASCGDGIVNAAAGEQCDDMVESAACDGDCTLAECGDGAINALAGESCDGPNLAGASCQTLTAFDGVLTCSAGCSYDTSACTLPILELSYSAIKQFDFGWSAFPGATHYQLEQSVAPGEPFLPLGGDIVGESWSQTMSLHRRYEASYRLQACDAMGCTESYAVDVTGSLAEAVGYVKASNTDAFDQFGWRTVMSDDGSTLVVSAPGEDSNAVGVDGDQGSNASFDSGAVYVFVRDGMDQWSQQAYVKASNTNGSDEFGHSLALSGDGDTLAVGAHEEDSAAVGIGGNQGSNSEGGSGAVYVFTRDGAGVWSQQAYVKASNTGSFDHFGHSVALSGDGSTMVVGAHEEDSDATDIGGDQLNDAAPDSGAAYVFTRDVAGAWSQEAYLKASATGSGDLFGWSVAVSGDGDTVAVGARHEDSDAVGIDGDQANDAASESGAVYVFARDGMGLWIQQAYVKPSNTSSEMEFGHAAALSGDGSVLVVGAPRPAGGGWNRAYVFTRDGMSLWSQASALQASNMGWNDQFGHSVALSVDGGTAVVGAWHEASNAQGLDGDQGNNTSASSGAAYVFETDAGGAWVQQAYVKPSNTDGDELFGHSVAVSGDGSIIAVGGPGEQSNAVGIDGDQADDTASEAGAVYLY